MKKGSGMVTRMWRGALACFAVLALWAAPAAAQAPANAYLLGINDQLEVAIYGSSESTGPIRVRIKPDGSITLPLVGTVRAAGQTAVGLAAQVRAELVRGGFLTNPVVNVEVTDFTSRTVTMLGNVARPGLYPLYAPQRLSTVLALAGGAREGSELVLLRREGQPEARLTLGEIARGGAADPLLQASDIVFVPDAERFFIYGQVRQPGSYRIEPGMTVRQALAQGGGPNDAGTETNLRLFRDGRQATVDALDTPVRDGDVLFVRERIF